MLSRVEVNFLKDSSDFHPDRAVQVAEKEIDKFERMFPGAKVIRNDYDSEDQLERDWQMYLELPYSLKVLSNERCLRAYGMKNETMYIKNKQKFLKQDIDNSEIMGEYRPSGLREEESEYNSSFVNKLAKDYMARGGHNIVTTDNKDYSSLRKQWYEFNDQCHEHKNAANNKSIELYGKPVPEVYRDQVKKYLHQDITNAEYGTSIISNTASNELAIESMSTYLHKNSNLIESAIMIDELRKTIESPVEKTIYNTIVEDFNAVYKAQSYPKLLTSNINMLDEEVLNSLNNDGKRRMLEDSNFIAFQAQLLGLSGSQFKPDRQDFMTESAFNKLKHGWNPVIKYSRKNCKLAHARMNNIIKESFPFVFIPLHEIEITLRETSDIRKGISIVTIRELDKDTDNRDTGESTKVFLSFNPNESQWYEYRNGSFLTKSDIEYTIADTASGMVNTYFIELSDGLYNRAQDILTIFNNSKNKLKTVINKLHEPAPKIANSKLFVVNLLAALFPEVGNNPEKVSIYHIYSGIRPTYKEIKDSFQKINVFTEYKNLTESTFLEDTFHPSMMYEPNTVEEWFDKDCKDFIHNESVDFDTEYQRVHNTLVKCNESGDVESMKYYVSKLMYMNKLIENKLYFGENEDLEYLIALPYLYRVRANVLKDYNNYTAKILETYPDFNISDYYAKSLYGFNTPRVEKSILSESFSAIKSMIEDLFSKVKL